MVNRLTIFTTLFLFGAIVSTFYIKISVQEMQQQMRQISLEIEKEKTLIRSLKTEIAFLESPKRIRNFTLKYIPELQNNILPKDSKPISNVVVNNQVKWRYKGKSKLETKR